eukprot:51889_1
MTCISCVQSCCKRTCQRQNLSYYYTQSLRESMIRTFHHQNNTAQHYLQTDTKMRIDTHNNIYDPKPSEPASVTASSLISESITRHTIPSMSNPQHTSPYTSQEQDIGDDRTPKALAHQPSLLSIPSYERIYFLPEHSPRNSKHAQSSPIPQTSVPFTTSKLIIYAICRSLGLHLFIVSGFATSKYGGASSILSFIVCSISTIITGFCLAELSCRIPMLQNHIYKYIYITNGELLAYIIGINSILSSIILNTLSCIAFSGYLQSFLSSLSLLTQTDVDKYPSLQYLFGKPVNTWIDIHLIPSIYALVIFIIFVLSRTNVDSRKRQYLIYISSACTVFIMVLFVVVAMQLISYSQIPDIWWKPCDYTECPSNAKNSFMPFEFQGWIASCGIHLLCFNGVFCVSKLAKYTANPQRVITHSIVGTTLIDGLVYTVMMMALLGLIPFESIDISSTYSSAFAVMHKPWLEGIFSLGAMCIILYFQVMEMAVAPVIMQQLSGDGLWFKVFSALDDDDNTPMRALIVFAVLCISCAAVFDMRKLIELAAMMNLVSHILICGSILIMRYSHSIHEKYHTKLKEKETTQSFQTKRKIMYQGNETQLMVEEDIKDDENMDVIDHQIHDLSVKMKASKEWRHGSVVALVWMYIAASIIICILVFYYDQIRGYHMNIWTFVTVFVCVFVVYLSGVFIYLHQSLE